MGKGMPPANFALTGERLEHGRLVDRLPKVPHCDGCGCALGRGSSVKAGKCFACQCKEWRLRIA